ncbi:hypothetical protein SELMODRAFT_429274 [Selaginella moellendorffii]|uniref:Uncharacterized protein n=1 Tax=Selaginella moellendorffii TaxID=88036 RepID=D8T5M3_SELML|nr:hypothetical protein SELMODRAFT_429274 [Selaginella moellendorffii]
MVVALPSNDRGGWNTGNNGGRGWNTGEDGGGNGWGSREVRDNNATWGGSTGEKTPGNTPGESNEHPTPRRCKQHETHLPPDLFGISNKCEDAGVFLVPFPQGAYDHIDMMPGVAFGRVLSLRSTCGARELWQGVHGQRPIGGELQALCTTAIPPPGRPSDLRALRGFRKAPRSVLASGFAIFEWFKLPSHEERPSQHLPLKERNLENYRDVKSIFVVEAFSR